MKTTTILLSAMLGGVALPTLAFAETKIANGCEIYLNGSVWNKVDATCAFDVPAGGSPTPITYVPPVEEPDDDEEPEEPTDPVDPPADDEAAH